MRPDGVHVAAGRIETCVVAVVVAEPAAVLVGVVGRVIGDRRQRPVAHARAAGPGNDGAGVELRGLASRVVPGGVQIDVGLPRALVDGHPGEPVVAAVADDVRAAHVRKGRRVGRQRRVVGRAGHVALERVLGGVRRVVQAGAAVGALRAEVAPPDVDPPIARPAGMVHRKARDRRSAATGLGERRARERHADAVVERQRRHDLVGAPVAGGVAGAAVRGRIAHVDRDRVGPRVVPPRDVDLAVGTHGHIAGDVAAAVVRRCVAHDRRVGPVVRAVAVRRVQPPPGRVSQYEMTSFAPPPGAGSSHVTYRRPNVGLADALSIVICGLSWMTSLAVLQVPPPCRAGSRRSASARSRYPRVPRCG